MRLKILGPPGTGKTTTVLSYIKQFQDDATVKNIIFCSFTVAAKNEAKRRCKSHERTTFATIHGALFDYMHYERVYMVNTLRQFAKSIGQTSTVYQDQQILAAKTPLERAIAYYQVSRCKMVKPGVLPLPPGLRLETIEAYIEEFERYKFRESKLDYNDVLVNYLKKGDQLEYDAALVDEAQDLSPLQWACVDKMFRSAQHYYTVGDDDQSIFSFAGVDAEDFINWKADQTVVLNYSHRLGKDILNYSKTVLRRISRRIDKQFNHCTVDSRIRMTSDFDPVLDVLPYTDTVILHRNAYLATKIKATLNEKGITYGGKGSPFMEKTPLKAIRLWEEWRSGEPMYGSAMKVIMQYIPDTIDIDKSQYLDTGRKAKSLPCPFPTVPWQNILEVPHKYIYMNVQDKHGIDYLLADPTVTITTIHQSKGGEWDKVILMTDMSAATYKQFTQGTQKEQDEEHRVWYVGLTRAKKELQIIRPQTVKYYPMEEL